MSTEQDKPTCELCGEPMPEGEEMFKFHGYSGPCPWPVKIVSMQPEPTPPAPDLSALWVLVDEWRRPERTTYRHRQHDDGVTYTPWRQAAYQLEETLLALGIPRPTPEGR